jgi:hypothetical protein
MGSSGRQEITETSGYHCTPETQQQIRWTHEKVLGGLLSQMASAVDLALFGLFHMHGESMAARLRQWRGAADARQPAVQAICWLFRFKSWSFGDKVKRL